MGIFVPSSFIFKTNKTSINVTTVESEESQWKHFPSVELTVAETSLEPSSSSVEEGDMQMYLLGRKHCPRPWILRGRHNFSKSQQQRQRSREIQFELELGHAFFTWEWCFAGVDLVLGRKRNIQQTLLDNILSLSLSHGEHGEDITQVNLGNWNLTAACLTNNV